MSSPSLRPLIDTCQKCSTSPANHEPRSPANGSFQNPGVCPQAVPSFPSPTPTVLVLALAPFSAQAKYRKPRSSVFLCYQTLRKRLLRRLVERKPANRARHQNRKTAFLSAKTEKTGRNRKTQRLPFRATDGFVIESQLLEVYRRVEFISQQK